MFEPGLRVPRHRTTTANLGAVYPFQAEMGLGPRGIVLGTNRLAGHAAFCFDPFELYTAKVITNPNMMVVGAPGSGKSAAVKCFLHRCLGALRSPGGRPRWGAIADPKGEYGPLAETLGLEVVRLHPGGTTRLNPLDAGPAGAWANPEELAGRRTSMVVALVGTVLGRDLSQVEDACVGWAVDRLAGAAGPTLADVARMLASPTAEMAERAGLEADELARRVDEVRFALGKLLDRNLRGMFDGASTVSVDWSGRGLVLDLSVVRDDAQALRVVMVAATAWLQAAMASPDDPAAPRRVQVLDEAWSLLADERTARYLQSCWKLC
ncbi:MAG: ATP-binding protein, partial [Acidimicrobiales bacterium]